MLAKYDIVPTYVCPTYHVKEQMYNQNTGRPESKQKRYNSKKVMR